MIGGIANANLARLLDAILILGPLALVGCAAPASEPTPPEPASSAPLVAVQPVAPAPEPALPPSAAPPARAFDHVTGELSLTKGAQPVVGGLILPIEAFEKRFGDDWAKHLEGRRVRASGKREIYKCKPMEQCLVGGSIPLMKDIVNIDVCATARHPGKVGRVEPVPCALEEPEKTRCLQICQEHSDDCDKGGRGQRGRLRKCGCARISCRQGCEEQGRVDFRCR